MLYDYTMLTEANTLSFEALCSKIDSLPDVKKGERAVDVDGSIIQIYSLKEKKFVVYNDIEVDAIYITSDIDLSESLQYLKSA